MEDMTLEATLHNISINPSSMDGPADRTIFESNHLAEIADIRSKLVHTQLLNPTPDELTNFITNHQRDFDSHLDHIFHLDDLLARDSRHCFQQGYPVINYPRYVPTMVELCRTLWTG